jgi:hypothetical protein
MTSIRETRARAHVDKIREKLKCASCGSPHCVTPIEFHHDDHPAHPERRVGSLVKRGAPLEEIDLEISKCEPLCKICHLTLDGRIEAFIERGRKYGEQCIWCNKLDNHLSKGLCRTCYMKDYNDRWPRSSIVCRRGHYRIGVNLYINPNTGRRYCIQCQKEWGATPYYRTEEKK